MSQLLKRGKLAVLIVLPFILLIIDNRWIFAPIGHTDTWIYFGYFLNFRQHLQMFSNIYFGDRLSWILLGAIVNSFLPALLANYVLHLGAYYLALFSFYFTLRMHFESKTALIASIIFGTHTLFLRSIGWNYTDGIGVAYFLLTLWILTCSAKLPRKRLYLLLAGFAFAATFYSNPLWFSVSPLLAGYYLFLTGYFRRPTIRKLIRPLSMTLSGFMLLTVAFALINIIVSGKFTFFSSSLGAVVFNMAVPNQWNAAWTYWLPRGSWLVFPIIFLISAVVFLWRNKQRHTESGPSNAAIAAFQWMFIGFWVIWLIWQIPINHPLLQTGYFVSYMLPCAFLAFGALIHFYAKDWIDNHFWQAVGLTIGILAIPLVVVIRLAPFFAATADYALLIPLVLGIIGIVIFLTQSPSNARSLVITLLLLSAANVLVQNATTVIHILDQQQITQTVGTADEYLTVYDSVKTIQKYATDGNIYFWYNSRDVLPYAPLYRSIASTYTWWSRYIKSDFPQFTDRITAIPDGATLVVLSPNLGNAETATPVLTSVGMQTQYIAEETIHHGPFQLVMTFIRVLHTTQRTIITF